MFFYRVDRDGNGKLTREELDGFFKSIDSGGQGFLSLSDLQEAFRPPSRPAPNDAKPKEQGGPSKEILVRGLFRQEIGSLPDRPQPLAIRPPISTLNTNDGKDEVTLSKLVGPKPVVLVFGNFTCGPFRSQAGQCGEALSPI